MTTQIKGNDTSTFGGDISTTGNITGDVAALSTASGSAPSYSARAWANINTSGTVSIRQSGNVSSVTDTATGQYTVNFATAMPDDGYSIIGQPSENAANSILLIVYRTGASKTVNGCAIQTLIDSGGFVDTYDINVAVFR
jgi:hypothetical protein